MNRLADFLVRSPKLIITVFIIITMVLGWFAQYFRIDASADTLLLENNRSYIETQVMNKRFSPQEFILLAYEPLENKVFSEQTFSDISRLMKSINAIERVESTTSILNVPLLSLMTSLDPDLVPENWTWESQKYTSQTMQNVFDKHPLYTDLLVNKAQTATAIQILFKPDPELTKIESEITDLKQKVLTNSLTAADEEAIEKLKRQADPIIQQLDKKRVEEIKIIYELTSKYDQQANIYLGGVNVLGFQLIEIIKQDLVVFGSSIAAMICLLLWILFRQWQWVVIPMLCCGVSVLMTVGLFGLLDMRTTVISSNFIALQLILTLAIVIHLIVEFRQLSESQSNLHASEIAKQTIINKATPCFYAGLTTSVGFGSLIFSQIQPVIAFGWMMIVAMLVSIVVSLVLFPPLLSLLKLKHKVIENRYSSWVIKQATYLASSKKAGIYIFSVFIFIVSIIGVLKLDVENSFINYFKASTNIHKELVYIDQQFGGSTPFDLVYSIPGEQQQRDLAITAEAIQTLQKIQLIMQQYPAIGSVTSIVNFADLAKKINRGKPLTEYELNVIYQLVDKSLTEKLLGAYFSPENQQLRISSRIQDTTEGLNRAEFLKSFTQDLDALGIPKTSIHLTNLFVLYQDILQRLFKSQIMTLGIVYVILTFVMFVIFRSVKIALIAITPNIISTLAILGTMGWLNIPLDLMTITIAAIAMGIAVDDTIHYIHRYRVESSSSENQQAIEKAFQSVGYAMLYTTLIIASGFCLLGVSDFVPSILFGLLTSLAMLVALLSGLLLLPALLNQFVHGARKLNNL